MKRILLAMALAAVPTLIHAEDAPQQPAPMVPITLSVQDINVLTAYLGNLSYNQASPVMLMLAQKEAQAQAAQAKK